MSGIIDVERVGKTMEYPNVQTNSRAFVVACGRWVEVPIEKVREAVKANAVFETLIEPIVKKCVWWGILRWRDGVLTGSDKGIAEQFIVTHYGGVEEAWLVLYTNDKYAERALEEARREGYEVEARPMAI